MTFLQRIQKHTHSPRLGILFLCAILSATVVWVQLAGNTPSAVKGEVTLHARFSQPLIVQGGDGTVYLNLSLTAPELKAQRFDERATDLVLVLDRSGSMAEGNKWQFAIQAVESLLDRLKPSDKISLVTFDTRGRVESPLIPATTASLTRLRQIVDGLRPGENTDMGEGLVLARGQLETTSEGARRKRVLLLSDGHANHGIATQEGLNRLVSRLSDKGAVVSAIGMGLGFNEVLMASLADHGMGRFSFLESLESLGTILAAELNESRQVFASGSEVRVELPTGIRLREAAGYPFSMEGNTAVIRTGQLLSGGQKKFMLTLEVNNQHLANYPLNRVQLRYLRDGVQHQQEISSSHLQVTCVAPEKSAEVVASVDHEIYREAWLQNNLGSLLKSVSKMVREGNEKKARQVLSDYRSKVEAAEEAAAVPGLADAAVTRLTELEARVDDAFQGADQKVKQNRAAKELLGASQGLQRVQKNKSRP